MRDVQTPHSEERLSPPSKGEPAKASLRDTNRHTNNTADPARAPLLTEMEAAERLRLSVKTLRAWRLRSKGPHFLRFGRAVRYLAAHLDEYVLRSTVATDENFDLSNRGER